MLSFRTTSDKLLLAAFVASVAVTLLLILIPVLHAIELSFYRSESFISERTWVGLGNYLRVLQEDGFWRALGIGAVFSLLTIRDGRLPPTINHDTPDPAIPLDVVPNAARDAGVRRVLSNSFGFGGQNVCLVLGAEPAG